MRSILLFIGVLSVLGISAQTQNIRGKIVDKESKFPLMQAVVKIAYPEMYSDRATVTDFDGNYALKDLPFGKYTLAITFLGYEPMTIPNVVVNTGKETILDIELEESIQTMETAVITGTRKDEANNEMASVSTTSFNVEETNRYAGSRQDPVRMASNLAGCQGADDSRNDIVVRGNAPTGVLWRIEDMDVPNPNHFAIAGTNGGAISMLNNKMLRKSDFFTSAFPAEYGNAIAGVMDLKYRNGNNQKHEMTGQFGFFGTELAAEGPLSDSSNASYLVVGRYSTLQLFNFMGINIGTDALPRYWDGSFKLNFPLKNNANLSFWGIGGKSDIDILVRNRTEPSNDIYGRRDRDQLFGTRMITSGVNYSKSVNKDLYFKLSAATAFSRAKSTHIKVERDSTFAVTDIWRINWYDIREYRFSLNSSMTYKFSPKSTLKAGVNYTHYLYDMFDYEYDKDSTQTTNIDINENAGLLRAFSQWKYKFTDNLVLNAGLNAQLFLLNNSTSIEPRIGLKYQINEKQSLSFGLGRHSQMQPGYIYFQQFDDGTGTVAAHNMNLDFTKSNHIVLGYGAALDRGIRFKTEVYYQQLSGLPVYADTATAFSLANFGSTYRFIYPPKLENTGTGTNYGIEFTVEKFFNKSFYVLSTLSLYDSKYVGSDGIERNTAFNGNFTYNALAGKEVTLGANDNKTLGFGGKVTWAGGRRFTPLDSLASIAANDGVEDMALTNSGQFRDYFRLDVKVSYKVNRPKVTHEVGLDLVNITDNQNILKKTYIPQTGSEGPQFVDEYQLGFLPIFYYKIDF